MINNMTNSLEFLLAMCLSCHVCAEELRAVIYGESAAFLWSSGGRSIHNVNCPGFGLACKGEGVNMIRFALFVLISYCIQISSIMKYCIVNEKARRFKKSS